MEYKYQFKADLLNVHKKDRRDFSQKPQENEVELKNGLALVVPEDVGDVIMTAARDFVDYLFVSMKISAMITHHASGHCIQLCLNQNIEDASGYMGYRISIQEGYILLE